MHCWHLIGLFAKNRDDIIELTVEFPTHIWHMSNTTITQKLKAKVSAFPVTQGIGFPFKDIAQLLRLWLFGG